MCSYLPLGVTVTQNIYCITGIFKQMAWAAGGACVGGVVAGPPGALVGSIAGKSKVWCKLSR